MNSFELLKSVQKLALEITHGDLDKVNLTCPNCSFSQIIFSFALNRLPTYGLYIHCKNCGLLHHFHLGSRPPNFHEDLILPEYQELENDAMLFSDNFDEHDTKNNKKGNKK